MCPKYYRFSVFSKSVRKHPLATILKKVYIYIYEVLTPTFFLTKKIITPFGGRSYLRVRL